MPDQVIDAQVVEDDGEHPMTSTSTAVAVRPRQRSSEVLKPLDRGQLVESFREYQELCKELLDDSDYQEFTQNEKGPKGEWRKVKKRFKKKSAWRKLAAAFDLDVVKVELVIERDETGQPLRARATYRAIAPSGRHQDGDGYCSITEPRFEKEKSRERIENDLPATATTRAKNRAISDLLGTGEVSAEEMTSDNTPVEAAGSSEPFGESMPDAIKKDVAQACVALRNGDAQAGIELYKQICKECGMKTLPHAAALALLRAALIVPAPEVQ